MVNLSITQTGSGKCALSNYEGEGLTVAFGSDQPLFLTWRSFKQLLALRLAQNGTKPMTLATNHAASSATTKATPPGTEPK